jgi:hypothetical protein
MTGYGAEQDSRADFTAHDMTEAVEIVLRPHFTNPVDAD